MKILMFNHNRFGEGTYFRCFQFARNIVKRGHEVTLITVSPELYSGNKTVFIEGVKVINSPCYLQLLNKSMEGYEPFDITSRLLISLFSKYDIVHGFDHKPNVLLPSIFNKYIGNTIFISDWCDFWGKGGGILETVTKTNFKFRTDFETCLENYIRRAADGVTVISRYLEKKTQKLGISEEKIFHIPSGADINYIKPQDKIESRKKLGIPVNTKIVEFVGLVEWDLDIVVKAIACIPDVKLLLVGPVKLKTRRLIKNLNIGNQVIVVGQQPYSNISEYLSCADVLALPLRDIPVNWARWPNKTGDYLASGRPIVSNPVGDIEEVIRENHCGLLSSSEPSDFAEKIKYLFENPSLCDEMGYRARDAAEKKYSWEIMTNKLEDAYDKILENKKI